MRNSVFVIFSVGLLASHASAAIVDADHHPSTIPFGPGAQAASQLALPLTQEEAAESLQMTLESHHSHFQIQDQAHVASHLQVASTASSRLTQTIANLEARWKANPGLFDRNNPIMGQLVADLVQLQAGTVPTLSSTLGAWFARRSLNPARFDHWHPTFGPMLSIDQQIRAFLANNPPPSTGTNPPGGQIVLPPGGGTTDNGGNPPGTVPNSPPQPPPPPPPLGEPAAPEPSAWLLLAMGAALLGCRAQRGRARVAV
jgi:hypothetical protein